MEDSGHSSESGEKHKPETDGQVLFKEFHVSLGGIAKRFYLRPNGSELSHGGIAKRFYLRPNGFELRLGGIAVKFQISPNRHDVSLDRHDVSLDRHDVSLGGYLFANGGADGGYHDFGQFLFGSGTLEVL